MSKKRRSQVPKICLILSDGFSEDEVEKGEMALANE